MTVDIARHSLSIVYRSADRQFSQQDKALEKARIILKVGGVTSFAKKDDVLKQLDDPTAKKLAEYCQDIHKARSELQKVLIKKPPRVADQLISAGIDMCNDASLTLEAEALQRKTRSTSENAKGQAQLHLLRIHQKMQKVEEELARLHKKAMEEAMAKAMEEARVKGTWAPR